MQDIIIQPIAFVHNSRESLEDDFWGEVVSEIELAEQTPTDSLQGIEDFSHIEIIFHFHLADKPIVYSRHPRGNKGWPNVGIFAQRGKDRPNKIGITVAELIKKEGRKLFVKHLDAIDGTPVIDIKPVMKEFLINPDSIKQPIWATELMSEYWK